MSEIAKIKLTFITHFSIPFSSGCNVYNYYLQKQIVIFTFPLKRQLRIALITLCASCARSWVECQHFSGGESWPYVLPHSFTPIPLSPQLQSPFTLHLWSDWAVSHLVCSSLFISLMDTFASRPLHPANNIASEMVKSQQMCLFVSPASASLAHNAAASSVCVAAWAAEELSLTISFLYSLKNSLPLLRYSSPSDVFVWLQHSVAIATNWSLHQSEHRPVPVRPFPVYFGSEVVMDLLIVPMSWKWVRGVGVRANHLFYPIKRFSIFAEILHFKCLIQVMRLEITVWGVLGNLLKLLLVQLLLSTSVTWDFL